MTYGFALLDSPKSVLFCSSASKKCLPFLFSFLHICMYISFKKSSCDSFPGISGRSKFRCIYSSCCPNSDVPHCFVICRYMLNSYTKDSVPQFFYFICNISLSVPHCFTYCFFKNFLIICFFLVVVISRLTLCKCVSFIMLKGTYRYLGRINLRK